MQTKEILLLAFKLRNIKKQPRFQNRAKYTLLIFKKKP